MTQFLFHSIESAPIDAQATLTAAQQKMGFIPNLYAGLANAPAALNGYLAIASCFEQSSFTPAEKQIILLMTSVVNKCEFCVAAHSMMAKKMASIPEEEVALIRKGHLPMDTKLAALADLTRTIVLERGWVLNHPAFTAFIAAGYSQSQALEVVLGVTQKTLSNYANHLLNTPLNPAFESESWTKED